MQRFRAAQRRQGTQMRSALPSFSFTLPFPPFLPVAFFLAALPAGEADARRLVPVCL